MAFELFLCPGRDDQISHLRRQEAPQPAHAFDFAHLIGDALFELLVQLNDFAILQLAGSLAQFFQHRAFSMAMTAWAAKFLTRAICLSVNGRTSWRYKVNIPTISLSFSIGTTRSVRTPPSRRHYRFRNALDIALLRRKIGDVSHLLVFICDRPSRTSGWKSHR